MRNYYNNPNRGLLHCYTFRKPRKTKGAVKDDPILVENAKLKKQNAELTKQVESLNESVAALQASLLASRSDGNEAESVDFNPRECPSSTQAGGSRRSPNNGLFVMNPAHRTREEDTVPDVTRWLSSITVGSINIPECKPSEGEQIGRRDFDQWVDIFSSHMDLAGVTDEVTKLALFKVKAGSALLEIFHHTKSTQDAPNVETFPFANAMHRMRTYFRSSSDVMLQRRRLRLLAQDANESDMAYVARAAKVARQCNFEDCKELEEIVGTLAGHGRSKELRVVAMTLLREINDIKDWNDLNDVKKVELTYQDLIDRIRGLEAINLNETHYKTKYNSNEQVTVAAVEADEAFTTIRQAQFRRGGGSGVGRFNSRFQPYRRPESSRGFGNYRGSAESSRGSASYRGTANFRRSNQYRWPERYGGTDHCNRCHSVYHKSDDCPAKDKTCLMCGKTGHLARACPSAYPTSNQRVENNGQVNAVSNLPALMDGDAESGEAAKPNVGGN